MHNKISINLIHNENIEDFNCASAFYMVLPYAVNAVQCSKCMSVRRYPTHCFFVTDLHGIESRYQALFKAIEHETPGAVFLGGDLLPSPMASLTSAGISHRDFLGDVIESGFTKLQKTMGTQYPQVFAILGNDDGRMAEAPMLAAATRGIWQYAHNRSIPLDDHMVYGYTYVPPTPFLLKDWERYDVSRYTDPGCVSPEEGMRTIPVPEGEIRYSTIHKDLQSLTGNDPMDKAIFLFHSPPYNCNLDRAALDGKMVNYAPLDVHVGSVAIQRFIAARQPLVTLHGHIHESARLTGSWSQRFGRTWAFNAAHDGPELSLISFDTDAPADATRRLL